MLCPHDRPILSVPILHSWKVGQQTGPNTSSPAITLDLIKVESEKRNKRILDRKRNVAILVHWSMALTVHYCWNESNSPDKFNRHWPLWAMVLFNTSLCTWPLKVPVSSRCQPVLVFTFITGVSIYMTYENSHNLSFWSDTELTQNMGLQELTSVT